LGDSLKDLLGAETDAEAIVSRGELERDRIIKKALDDALEMEKQFLDRLPEIQQSFLDKAQQRATQTIAEMKLRCDERGKQLRELAGRHEDEAMELALALLLDNDQDVA
jgi:V/A-type H+/Na+-transporting ATPase subunit G/H